MSSRSGSRKSRSVSSLAPRIRSSQSSSPSGKRKPQLSRDPSKLSRESFDPSRSRRRNQPQPLASGVAQPIDVSGSSDPDEPGWFLGSNKFGIPQDPNLFYFVYLFGAFHICIALMNIGTELSEEKPGSEVTEQFQIAWISVNILLYIYVLSSSYYNPGQKYNYVIFLIMGVFAFLLTWILIMKYAIKKKTKTTRVFKIIINVAIVINSIGSLVVWPGE